MTLDILKKMSKLEIEIKEALTEENFVKVFELSEHINLQIREFASCFENRSDVSTTEIELFTSLRRRVELFEKQTEESFKQFAGKTSAQTKMRNAYMKYGI
jgi:hypothetical protein